MRCARMCTHRLLSGTKNDACCRRRAMAWFMHRCGHGHIRGPADEDCVTLRALWLGVLLWGVMFAVASALYPWSVATPALLASFMAVVLAGVTTTVATAYLRQLEGGVFWRVFKASLTWTATCVLLDLAMLMTMPPRLSIREYLQQIGLTYLMIPVIAMGLAYQRVLADASAARPSRQALAEQRGYPETQKSLDRTFG